MTAAGTRKGIESKSLLGPGIVLLALACLGDAAATPDPYAEARELFKLLYPDVQRGDWSTVDALPGEDRAALEAYPLWPDLEAAWLRASLKRVDRMRLQAYLDRYGTHKPARELRYRYALYLGRAGMHKEYLDLYRAHYAAASEPRLDCLAQAAAIELGETSDIVDPALALWLTGESQVDECDPVFAWLGDKGLLTRAHYEERFQLAIEARAFTRARWLGKSIGDEYVAEAEAWQRAATAPAAYLHEQSNRKTENVALDRLVYALERLTYRDPEQAAEFWSAIEDKHPFADEDRRYIERHIALWTARDWLPGAYERLSALPDSAQDVEVMRWRARVALRSADWQRLAADIDAMPASESKREEWRYWRAVAAQQLTDGEYGTALFTTLAAERSYYGFLAADALGLEYTFGPEPLTADSAIIDRLAARPELVRARELFLVGLDSRGRSEWDAAMRSLSRQEQLQAAILAHRWGWHSRAIATSAGLAEYDDLELRYPLAFAEHFVDSAEAAGIPATWALGVARSESIFMRDVRSRAGAIGVMQLMPRTGRAVAGRINLTYVGNESLTDPATNIRLGSSYLGQMSERFGGNRVLATAAYNAGPHRVTAWLQEGTPVETRIWIENIPFNETRKYVRRVLAAETIFHWRMTGETRRLAELLSKSLPAPTGTIASLGGDEVTHHLDR